jgi:hypothetical protein
MGIVESSDIFLNFLICLFEPIFQHSPKVVIKCGSGRNFVIHKVDSNHLDLANLFTMTDSQNDNESILAFQAQVRKYTIMKNNFIDF